MSACMHACGSVGEHVCMHVFVRALVGEHERLKKCFWFKTSQQHVVQHSSQVRNLSCAMMSVTRNAVMRHCRHPYSLGLAQKGKISTLASSRREHLLTREK